MVSMMGRLFVSRLNGRVSSMLDVDLVPLLYLTPTDGAQRKTGCAACAGADMFARREYAVYFNNLKAVHLKIGGEGNLSREV